MNLIEWVTRRLNQTRRSAHGDAKFVEQNGQAQRNDQECQRLIEAPIEGPILTVTSTSFVLCVLYSVLLKEQVQRVLG